MTIAETEISDWKTINGTRCIIAQNDFIPVSNGSVSKVCVGPLVEPFPSVTYISRTRLNLANKEFMLTHSSPVEKKRRVIGQIIFQEEIYHSMEKHIKGIECKKKPSYTS